MLEPTAVVRHVGSASSRKLSGFAEYHGTRNRLWKFAKLMPAWLLPVALPAHVLVALYVLARSPSRELRQARWRGLRDGLRGLRPFLGERRRWRPGAAFVRALSWSPVALSRRRPVWRPLADSSPPPR